MDATCAIQNSIHVFSLVHINMCPGFWVHIILFFYDTAFFICCFKQVFGFFQASHGSHSVCIHRDVSGLLWKVLLRRLVCRIPKRHELI